jgi:hypothetical protein
MRQRRLPCAGLLALRARGGGGAAQTEALHNASRCVCRRLSLSCARVLPALRTSGCAASLLCARVAAVLRTCVRVAARWCSAALQPTSHSPTSHSASALCVRTSAAAPPARAARPAARRRACGSGQGVPHGLARCAAVACARGTGGRHSWCGGRGGVPPCRPNQDAVSREHGAKRRHGSSAGGAGARRRSSQTLPRPAASLPPPASALHVRGQRVGQGAFKRVQRSTCLPRF